MGICPKKRKTADRGGFLPKQESVRITRHAHPRPDKAITAIKDSRRENRTISSLPKRYWSWRVFLCPTDFVAFVAILSVCSATRSVPVRAISAIDGFVPTGLHP